MEGVELKQQNDGYLDFELMDAFRIVGYSLLGLAIFFMPIKIDGHINTILYHLYYYIENEYIELIKVYIIIMVVVGSIFPLLNKNKDKNISVVKNIYEAIRPISILIILMVFTKKEISLVHSDTLLFIEDIVLKTSILFPLSSLFLPLIMRYGLLEVSEAYFNKQMKKAFKLSGKNIINIAIYLMVDVFSGIFMTNQLYKEGKLRQIEASIMTSCFAFTSLGISMYVIDELNFKTRTILILTSIFLSLIINFIICRIWPLNNKKKSYIRKSNYKESNFKNEKFKKAIRKYISNREKRSLFSYMVENFKESFDIIMTIIPNLIIIIFIGEFIINSTDIIEILSSIIYPFLEILKIPNVDVLSEFTLTSMFSNIRAIDMVNVNVENIVLYLIIFTSITQTVSLTTNILYIDNTDIPINKRELITIGIWKTLILLMIISITYYLIMGYL